MFIHVLQCKKGNFKVSRRKAMSILLIALDCDILKYPPEVFDPAGLNPENA